MPEGLAVLNADGLIQSSNYALARLAGQPEASFVNTHLSEWLVNDQGESGGFHVSIKTGTQLRCVFEEYPFGPHSNVGFRFSPIERIQVGEMLRFVVVFKDISERIEAETEMQRLATTDALTSVMNRHAFLPELKKSLENRKNERNEYRSRHYRR